MLKNLLEYSKISNGSIRLIRFCFARRIKTEYLIWARTKRRMPTQLHGSYCAYIPICALLLYSLFQIHNCQIGFSLRSTFSVGSFTSTHTHTRTHTLARIHVSDTDFSKHVSIFLYRFGSRNFWKFKSAIVKFTPNFIQKTAIFILTETLSSHF